MPVSETDYKALLEENERLKLEVARLQKASEKEIQSRAAGTQMGIVRSIVGLDEKIVQLDEHDQIEYINGAMAKMLNIERKTVIGKHVSVIDNHAWGMGVLMRQVEEAKKTGADIEIEKTYEDDDGKEHIYDIRTSVIGGKAQILVQDVTRSRMTEQLFKRMVSPEVVERVMEMGKDFATGERYEMTVLFADLRGFTSMAQNMPPEAVRETCNEFLASMTDVIIKHQGTIDKYVGDEVMALFGAPYYFEDHAIKSLNAAIDMQLAHLELIKKWAAAGRPQVKMGIGINTGEMVVGMVGSELRTDFTVLGHHVNLAARLCGLAGPGDIWLGPRTFQLIKEHVQRYGANAGIRVNVKFKPAGSIQAKGIDKPVDIVNVVLKDV